MAFPASDRTAPTPSRLSAPADGPVAAIATLCLGAVALGISPVFVRFASAEVSPFGSAFWRVALALPPLYLWMRIAERRGRPAGWGIDRATLLAGVVFAGDLFFWHLAILKTTVANATFFATAAPVFVVLVTWLVLRRRIEPGTLGGLALCLAGGAALIGQSLEVAPERLAGDLDGIATALFFGLYFIFVERARAKTGAARVTFQLSVVTAAILLVVALAVDPAAVWPKSLSGWGSLFALAWIAHAGGQGLLSVALGRLPAVFSSLVIFLEAVVAAATGWVVLGEALAPVQWLGGALILAGIWTARPRARQDAP